MLISLRFGIDFLIWPFSLRFPCVFPCVFPSVLLHFAFILDNENVTAYDFVVTFVFRVQVKLQKRNVKSHPSMQLKIVPM